MKRKMTKSKPKSGKKAASKLKSRVLKAKTRQKKAAPVRKPAVKARKKPAPAQAKAKTVTATPAGKSRIVRIMGQGQYTVDTKTLKRLNDIDNAIVTLVSQERSDDVEFRKRLAELNDIVVKDGKPLDPHEIIRSDIILPSADLSVDEAKKLFRGDGVIPEI